MRSATTVLAAALAMALAPATGSGQDFEGVIQMRIFTASADDLAEHGIEVSESALDVPPQELLAVRDRAGDEVVQVYEPVYHLKGGRMRADAPATDVSPALYVITDVDAEMVWMVNTDQQVVLEIPFEEGATDDGEGASLDPGTIRDIGETRSLHGLEATAHEMDTDDGATRVWLTREQPALTRSFQAMLDRMSALTGEADVPEELIARTRGGFPVLVQSLQSGEFEVTEVLSIEQRPVSDDRFAIPSDYRRISMDDLRGGN
jgi:hypothetical protein